jgi:YHYH protein
MKRFVLLTATFVGIGLVGIPAARARTIDRTKLTLGVVSSSAKKNSMWSCRTGFDANAAGAQKSGAWINGDGTWDKTKKPSVAGSVKWPNANLSVTVSGANRVITGNLLPVTNPTGVYPIASSDPAYEFDRNPGSIRAQTVSLSIPASPKVSAQATCVGGEVGISLDGPAIFSAIDAGGRDAQAYELQDSCSGHPQNTGQYHFHGLSDCTDKTKQFGWALDGFPIWGPIDPVTGQEWSNDELDECHGITSEITIDGAKVTMYHYVANDQYPYVVGCFRGTTSARAVVSGGGQPGGGGGLNPPGQPLPPPAPTAAATTAAPTKPSTTVKKPAPKTRRTTKRA